MQRLRTDWACDRCGEDGHGEGYRCTVCNLDLHKSCATVKMAEEKVIQHPSHPGHCLSYVRYSHTFVCDSCLEHLLGNGYRCAACEFDLHISCATVNMAEEKIIKHASHPEHYLSFCQYKNGFICNGCGLIGHGKRYRCAACDFDLHISCATANMAEQKVIQHPSHPAHWLRYVRYPSGYKCNGCGEPVLESQNGYRCDACNFDLHECCATAPPVLDQSFHGGNGKWVHFQMEPPGGSQMRCSKCEQSVSGFGYYCISGSCEYALHPTCAVPPRSHPQVETTAPKKEIRKGKGIERGAKALLHLVVGAITGEPASIASALADFALSN